MAFLCEDLQGFCAWPYALLEYGWPLSYSLKLCCTCCSQARVTVSSSSGGAELCSTGYAALQRSECATGTAEGAAAWHYICSLPADDGCQALHCQVGDTATQNLPVLSC